MKRFIIISFILFSFPLFAQQNKIDSLENLLKTAKEDTVKINLLNSLGWEIRHTLPSRAMQYCDNALSLSRKNAFQPGISQSLSNIGAIYYINANYQKSLQYQFESLKIREKLGDKIGVAVCMNNIANNYADLGDLKKAKDFYEKVLEIYKGINHYKGMRSSLLNIGNIYADMGENDKANKCYQLSLTLSNQLNDSILIASTLNNIGTIYLDQKKYSVALSYFFQSLKIRKHTNNKYGQCTNLSNIASTYNNLFLATGKGSYLNSALNFYRQGLNLSTEIRSKDDMKICLEGISISYGKMKDYQHAYEYHKKFSEIKDSLFNEESSNLIAEISTKYETEKKELQIENLDKDNAIKETEIKKQNFQKLAFAGGFGLMLILAFVIFRGYNQKKKANEIISAQKSEVEKQKEIVDQKNQSLEVAYKHIEEKNTEILDSIRYAKRIQEAILPPQKLVKQHLEESFILYKPKDIVAGDFYWMETIQNKVLFASVDCTGHGVPGAFMSILGYNGLNRCMKEFGLTQPAAILDKLCELVDEVFSKSEVDIKDGMDIALCAMELPSPNGEELGVSLQYSGAGNSLYHIRNNILTEYSADKQPIGKFSYRKPFTNHEIQLQKEDAIYIFTDGYADQFGGPKGKKFKYKQFEELLLSIQDKTMTEQREILNDAIDNWRGDLEQIDDICIIGAKI